MEEWVDSKEIFVNLTLELPEKPFEKSLFEISKQQGCLKFFASVGKLYLVEI
jgi:hypothetical protein